MHAPFDLGNVIEEEGKLGIYPAIVTFLPLETFAGFLLEGILPYHRYVR